VKENLYIRDHRYTNPKFREEFERIFRKDSDSKELERDIQTEMKKGKVTGHFI